MAKKKKYGGNAVCVPDYSGTPVNTVPPTFPVDPRYPDQVARYAYNSLKDFLPALFLDDRESEVQSR